MADTVKCKRCGHVVSRKRLAQRYCTKACANAGTQGRKRASAANEVATGPKNKVRKSKVYGPNLEGTPL
jgi:hypothetical protein